MRPMIDLLDTALTYLTRDVDAAREEMGRLRDINADLLAACKLALEPGSEDPDERQRRRAVCRAAIAKAEGR